MTQIGQRPRISQMRVSGPITHALGYLRSRLLEMEEHASSLPIRRWHPSRQKARDHLPVAA
jgi:hypothetical protein